MKKLGNILLEMNPPYTYPPLSPTSLYLKPPVLGYGELILGYLLTLHKIRVGIVLPVKFRIRGYLAVQGEGCHYGVFNSLFVYNGKNTGGAETDGTYKSIGGSILIISPAGAEHLAPGKKLGMNLKPYYNLVIHPLSIIAPPRG